jgi:spore maturation protein CgeB
MRIAMFYHSLLSDWNHGNAHFLRGVVSELLFRGHDVRVYEPANNWSLQNLKADAGNAAIVDFQNAYPDLTGTFYDQHASLDVDNLLRDVDLVIVHEWNEPDLVARIGTHHARHPHYRLLFHDTHHRAVTDAASMARYDLSTYDGVLAFGRILRDIYLSRKWTRRAWTWHEAADTRLFRPIPDQTYEGDVVWIGNWGDDERTAELRQFLLEPIRQLNLRARFHGVRYPAPAIESLARSGIEYCGYIPNHKAPETFARFRFTVHVPRRAYVQALKGIPTIRVFEALACGIPLICAPWSDAENLFSPGQDYLVARDGEEMKRQMRRLLDDPESARNLAAHGHRTILSRHTCAHRVDELLNIDAELCNEASRRNDASHGSTDRKAAACITA